MAHRIYKFIWIKWRTFISILLPIFTLQFDEFQSEISAYDSIQALIMSGIIDMVDLIFFLSHFSVHE